MRTDCGMSLLDLGRGCVYGTEKEFYRNNCNENSTKHSFFYQMVSANAKRLLEAIL